MEHFNRASSTSKVQRISSSNNAADFNHATSLYSGRAEQSLPWLNPTGLCSVALLGHFAWSSFHVQALCRHLSRKSLLLSSFTLPRLSRKAGSVLPGGRCRASTTATTPSSSPSSSFSLLADAWQCAYWRTLPRPLHLHPTLITFPASGGCLAVCSLEDAALCISSPHTLFPSPADG